jgi:hypothetical protein
MSAGVVGDVVAEYGNLVETNSTVRSSATTDIIQVAIVNDTIKVATQAMRRQFPNFLDVTG